MCPILFFSTGKSDGPARKGWLVAPVRVGESAIIVTESSGMLTTSVVQEIIVANDEQLVFQTLNRRYLLTPSPGYTEQWQRLCGAAGAAAGSVAE
jgi:hypothetical protein